jgi:hypothetical protein
MVNDNSLIFAMIVLAVVTVIAVALIGGGNGVGSAASTNTFLTPCNTFTTEQNSAWHVSWVCSASDSAICNRNDMCSYDGLCYSNDYAKMFLGQENDKYAVCAGSQDHKWLDPDGGEAQCLELNKMFPGQAQWAVAGEQVGEYFSDFNGGGNFPYECCGDDAGEFPIATGVANTPYVCCSSASDTVALNSGYWQCK